MPTPPSPKRARLASEDSDTSVNAAIDDNVTAPNAPIIPSVDARHPAMGNPVGPDSSNNTVIDAAPDIGVEVSSIDSVGTVAEDNIVVKLEADDNVGIPENVNPLIIADHHTTMENEDSITEEHRDSLHVSGNTNEDKSNSTTTGQTSQALPAGIFDNGSKQDQARTIIAWISIKKDQMTQIEREDLVLRLPAFIQIIAAYKLELNVGALLAKMNCTDQMMALDGYANAPRQQDVSIPSKEISATEVRSTAVAKYRQDIHALPDHFENGLSTRFFLDEEANRITEVDLDVEWLPYDLSLPNKSEYTVKPDGQNLLANLLDQVYAELKKDDSRWIFVPFGERRFQCPLHTYDPTACDADFGLRTIDDVIAHLEIAHHKEDSRCPNCFEHIPCNATRQAHILLAECEQEHRCPRCFELAQDAADLNGHAALCENDDHRPPHWGITTGQADDLRAFALTHNTDQVYDEMSRRTRPGVPRTRGSYLDDYSSWVVQTVSRVVTGAGELQVPVGEGRGEEIEATEWYTTRLANDLLGPRVKARQARFVADGCDWRSLWS